MPSFAPRDESLPADKPMSVRRLEWEYIWKVMREHIEHFASSLFGDEPDE